MKTGKSIVELAREIERQAASARDFVVPTNQLTMVADDKVALEFSMPKAEESLRFGINQTAHDQIAAKLDIPKKYYERMREQEPALLATNVNHWFRREPENRMVRTLDGNARAFLSNRFRLIDNIHVAKAALPILGQMNDIEIISSEVTEKRMYIQAVTKRVQAEVKKGDVVQMGIVIGNSEVGAGAIRVEPLIYRLVCLNGMIRAHTIRRYHIGKRLGGDDVLELENFYRTETIEANTKAFLMTMQDTVRHAFDEAAFAKEVDLLRTAADRKIETLDLQSVVTEVTKQLVMPKDEGDAMLRFLIEGGDLSQWGLANAVTRTANESFVSYDRAVELERLGGEIIDLSPTEWNKISTAGK